MTIQNYCLIDANNTVDNVVLWDGDTTTWTPPVDHAYVVQATTPSRDWAWDKDLDDWVLVEIVGHGEIGFVWDGYVLTTSAPKPPVPQPSEQQPAVTGAQTL
jgi:hypothetical protein